MPEDHLNEFYVLIHHKNFLIASFESSITFKGMSHRMFWRYYHKIDCTSMTCIIFDNYYVNPR